MLTYKSLFDEVTSEDLKRFYAFKGTVEKILEELTHKPTNPVLIYHPARLIKGLIDYKILHPDKIVIFDILRYLVELTKEIYSIHTIQLFKLTNFKMLLMQNGLEEFLKFEVIQDEDTAACLSSVGHLTQKTAQKIYQQTAGKPILLIPMAHGATAPGIDLFLRYSILSQNNFSTIYPCRFSVHKQQDATPHLSEKEIWYLKSQAHDKEVVIFEENVVTGTTVETAAKYFNETLFSEQEIMQVTNLDISKQNGVGGSSNSREEMLKQFLLQYEETE